ncbi:MAG: peptide MFS transporter, partial [Planctomycetia bacterium]
MARKKHPHGLVILFFTEMWERFGFYLMMGIFALYMIEPTSAKFPGLGFSEARSADIVGTFLALVYLTPFLGGMLADRKIGYRISIIIGGCLMGTGYIGLSLPGELVKPYDMIAFWGSLFLIIMGNGFFKPCISVLLGKLYETDEYRELKDSGFNIFYMGINIGAFFCNFVASFLRINYGWGWAFAAAGVGMYVGVIWFLYGNFLVPNLRKADKIAPPKPGEQNVLVTLACLFGPATLAGVFGWFVPEWLFGKGAHLLGSNSADAFFAFSIPVVFFFFIIWYKANKHEREPIAALLAIYTVVIVFWAVFHQNGTALTYWTKNYTVRSVDDTTAKVINVVSAVEEVSTIDREKEKTDPHGEKLGKETGASYYYDNMPEKEWPKGNLPTFTREQLEKAYKSDENSTLGKPSDMDFDDWKKLSVDEKYAVAGRPRDLKDEDWKKVPVEDREKHGFLKLWPTELQASINPFFVVILTPLVVGFFNLLRRHQREPSTPAKIGIGLIISGIAVLIMAAASYFSGSGTMKTGVGWLISFYGIITIGELCLSPMGLSLVTKLSPPRIVGVMMGGWMLSCALGNKLSGILAGLWGFFPNKAHYFLVNSVLILIAGGGVFLILP